MAASPPGYSVVIDGPRGQVALPDEWILRISQFSGNRVPQNPADPSVAESPLERAGFSREIGSLSHGLPVCAKFRKFFIKKVEYPTRSDGSGRAALGGIEQELRYGLIVFG